ncbi:MAG: SOS response-associated peptidase family protein [Verrucomicrobia bacterium]|nr:SOS response-associated peptidase family protein [Verrucomicrobiota bacterium]
MKDGRPVTFSGLCENWKDPESGEWVRTRTTITGEPDELVAQINPRMPVVVSNITQLRGDWGLPSKQGQLKLVLSSNRRIYYWLALSRFAVATWLRPFCGLPNECRRLLDFGKRRRD